MCGRAQSLPGNLFTLKGQMRYVTGRSSDSGNRALDGEVVRSLNTSSAELSCDGKG